MVRPIIVDSLRSAWGSANRKWREYTTARSFSGKSRGDYAKSREVPLSECGFLRFCRGCKPRRDGGVQKAKLIDSRHVHRSIPFDPIAGTPLQGRQRPEGPLIRLSPLCALRLNGFRGQILVLLRDIEFAIGK